MSKYASRACTLLAKVVQNLANLVPFGEKEPHMKALNEFVKENMPRMKEFLDVLCAQVAYPRNHPNRTLDLRRLLLQGTVLKSQQGERYSQLSPDTWLEKELAMCTVYLDDCREHWFSDEVCKIHASHDHNLISYCLNRIHFRANWPVWWMGLLLWTNMDNKSVEAILIVLLIYITYSHSCLLNLGKVDHHAAERYAFG